MKNEIEIDDLLKEARVILEQKKKFEEEKNLFELNATIRFSTLKIKKEKMGPAEMTERNNKRKEIEERLFTSKSSIEELKTEICARTQSMFFDKRRDFLKMVEDNKTEEDIEMADNSQMVSATPNIDPLQITIDFLNRKGILISRDLKNDYTYEKDNVITTNQSKVVIEQTMCKPSQKVALKFILFMPNEIQKSIKQFENEIELLHKLKSHPNIIAFNGVFFHKSEFGLTEMVIEMPFIENTLDSFIFDTTNNDKNEAIRINPPKPLNFEFEDIIELFIQIFKVLNHIHANGIVH